MSKMAAMQQALEKASTASSKKVVSIAPAAPATEEVQAEPRAKAAAKPKPKPVAASRVGKVHLGAYLPPEFKKCLMLVRAQTGKTETALLAAALNDLFRAHNVPVVDMD